MVYPMALAKIIEPITETGDTRVPDHSNVIRFEIFELKKIMVGPAIGIDLGTTHCCVGVWQNNQVEIIRNDDGDKTTPSWVAFTEKGRVIGEDAKKQASRNYENTVFDAKRLIGKRFTDDGLEQDMELWPFNVIKGARDIPKIVVSHMGEKKEFSAEEISSMVLRKMKQIAENFLGKTVEDAVISVPAYFDDSQRQATRVAAHVAGLKVLRIINEPTAAAINYGLERRTGQTNVLVFDLGGGTFDVSLVNIDGNGKFTVKAVAGDTHLGGRDFDNKMVDHFIEELKTKKKIDIKGNPKAIARLRVACEDAKRELSSRKQEQILVDNLHGDFDFCTTITREKFEDLNKELFSKCMKKVESCLKDANMDKKNVDEVVLVGGSTRIPRIQELLQIFFDRNNLSKKVHPDEAIAYGATVLAAQLSGEISQKFKNLEYSDVAPLSVGVKLYNDKMSILIPRNTPIPTTKEKKFNTFMDNQSFINVQVYQGETKITKDGNRLGVFEVSVPPKPKGESKVNVVCSIDKDGILNCLGEEVSTGLKKNMVGRLSEEEIKKMIKDAEKMNAPETLEEYVSEVLSKIETLRITNRASNYRKNIKKMEEAIRVATKSVKRDKLPEVDIYEKALTQVKKSTITDGLRVITLTYRTRLWILAFSLIGEDFFCFYYVYQLRFEIFELKKIMVGPAIGIDLGTTHCCVGVWQNNRVEIIPNDDGDKTTPSWVAFTDKGRLIGEDAKKQAARNYENTVFDAKRLIGKRFTDHGVKQDVDLWPFNVINGARDIPKIVVKHKGEDKEFSAEEISSMLLRKMKQIAEKFLGRTVEDAVITVPAYFDDSQRQATKVAAHIAGLKVLRIINEPTAAAINYGLEKRTGKTNVLVFDLGGGTFDVSLVNIDGNGNFKVKAVAGDTHLGGRDFDNKMVDHLIEKLKTEKKIDIKGNPKATTRLRVACEDAKRQLSLSKQATIPLDSLYEDVDFHPTITREKFEDLNKELFSKCIKKVESCLKDANMDKKNVDEVVLVGGSTRIPRIQELLQKFFNRNNLSKKIHPDEAIAYGATVLAAQLSGEISEKFKNLKISDVAPLSVGVKLYNDTMFILIPRNTTIPTKKRFNTFMDNQGFINVHLYQGERKISKDSNRLGVFEVSVPPKPEDESKANVVCSIDKDGILNCFGEEVSTGLKKNMVGWLSEEEIKMMIKDAEKINAPETLEEYVSEVLSKIETLRITNRASKYRKTIKKMEEAVRVATKSVKIDKHPEVDTYEKALTQVKKINEKMVTVVQWLRRSWCRSTAEVQSSRKWYRLTIKATGVGGYGGSMGGDGVGYGGLLGDGDGDDIYDWKLSTNGRDRKWLLSSDGCFSVAVLKTMIEGKFWPPMNGDLATRWVKTIPKKVTLYMIWRARRGRLPTRENLHNMGLIWIQLCACPRCNTEVETTSHVLLNCVEVKKLWSLVAQWWNMDIQNLETLIVSIYNPVSTYWLRPSIMVYPMALGDTRVGDHSNVIRLEIFELEKTMVGPAIGIDLGTTHCCVGVWQNNQVEIIRNDDGDKTTPSWVAFTDKGRIIGEDAKKQASRNYENVVFDAKRLIGKRFTDDGVKQDMERWPFNVIKGARDIPKIVVKHKGEEKAFSAEEISSMLLRKMKQIAEKFLGKTVEEAVITVPAYFDDSQRQATKVAAHVAGLKVLRIINEPTAAAINYGLEKRTGQTNVLVFDLGGGTFDVSLVNIDGNGKFKVKAVAGDTHLGGRDFDNKMVDHLIEEFKSEKKIDIKGNPKATARLRVACEKAKQQLSSSKQAPIPLDSLHEGVDFHTTITREKFEDLNKELFSKCIKKVESCLRDANMDKENVDEVVLVGGSTRIPRIQELLQKFFNRNNLSKKVNPYEAIAYGATVLAAQLSGEISEKFKNLEISDVTPLSVGVKLYNDTMFILIPRNTTIPTKKRFNTFMDNQGFINVHLYQGERKISKDSNRLGVFEVSVPPKPEDESKVNVVCSIDKDGILNCFGEQVSTGLKKNMIGRLSQEEIEKMRKDAEKYELDDQDYNKKINARNALEGYINEVSSKIETISDTNKTWFYWWNIKKMKDAIKAAAKSLKIDTLSEVDKYEKSLHQLQKLCKPIIS
ncbi:hypothetical protein OSB04_023224 [Centaurea solstitialis]|uniref:Reverse transcriptase zinc-binding domain-containing protein n=1 Tax=Centaurea solstitialis TaxID=347529 RepID=A0AA38VZF1_9ASTR|nr:hypothetical protein OSB04_023224 [Centaurea solstitialis]